MDRDINEQAEMVNRIIEKEAAGDRLNNAASIKNDHHLLNAVHLGKCEAVTDMLQLGASVEAENAAQVPNDYVGFMTPLQVAASKGYADIVQILIDHGANVHARSIKSGTALYIAASNGHCDCIKMLIKAGADAFASIGMSCKEEAFDRLGASALNLAVKNNHLYCVQELLEFGLDSNARDENGESFRDAVAKHAIYKCEPTNNPFVRVSKAALIAANYTFEEPLFANVLFYKRMKMCAKALVFMGSFENDIKTNGISQLPDWTSTGLEDVDLEIFKLFILESYCVDHHVPRGLTGLCHFGFEYYNSKIAAILITCFADIVMKEGHLILNMNLIEYLLYISDRFDALKYVVKCILWVPCLNSLTLLPIANVLHKHNFYFWEDLVLPPNVTFALKRGETGIYVDIYDRETDLINVDVWSDIVTGVPKYGRYPLQQPLISLINERISDEMDELVDHYDALNLNMNPSHNIYYSELLKLRKYLWYEVNAFNIPTLQQCCRYCILKYMGPLNVKNIRKLSLPDKLKSYLLFL